MNHAIESAGAGVLGGLAGAAAMNLFQASGRAGRPDLDEIVSARVAAALPFGVSGRAVHYLTGAAAGAIYGAAARRAGWLSAGFGSAFGAAFWLAADAIAVPALGLAGPRESRSARLQARALAAHIVYALSLEAVRLAIR